MIDLDAESVPCPDNQLGMESDPETLILGANLVEEVVSEPPVEWQDQLVPEPPLEVTGMQEGQVVQKQAVEPKVVSAPLSLLFRSPCKLGCGAKGGVCSFATGA